MEKPMTKTQVMLEHFEKGELKQALAIAKDFMMRITEKERKTITRAFEMEWNEDFYTQLGYNKAVEQEKAKNIIERTYAEELKGGNSK